MATGIFLSREESKYSIIFGDDKFVDFTMSWFDLQEVRRIIRKIRSILFIK